MKLKTITKLITKAIDEKVDDIQDSVNVFIDDAQDTMNGFTDDMQDMIKEEIADISKDKIITIITENKKQKEKELIHSHKYNKKRVKKEELKKGIPALKKFIAKNIFEDVLFYDHMTSQFIINVHYCDSQGNSEKLKRQAYIGSSVKLDIINEFLYLTHKNTDNELIQFTINLNDETLIKDEIIYENDIEDIESKEPYKYVPMYD